MVVAAVLAALVLASLAWWPRRFMRHRKVTSVNTAAIGREASQLVYGLDENPSIIIRIPSEADCSLERRAIDLPRDSLAGLSSALGPAPRLLIAGAELASSGSRLVMQFKPETAKALSEGTLSLVKVKGDAGTFRAIARNPSGSFVEHAKFLTRSTPRLSG